jgi:hypothetical protein
VQVPLERIAVQDDRQRASLKRSLIRRIEQVPSQGHGLSDRATEPYVQLANDRNPNERLPCDPASYSSPPMRHLGDVVLREQIVGPLVWGIDCKCSHGNAVESHTIVL